MIQNLLQLTVNIQKQGKRFVAYAPALDIATSGKTEKEVRLHFNELVTIFLEELHTAGTTDAVLRELGWKKIRKEWTPPTIQTKAYSVQVPEFA